MTTLSFNKTVHWCILHSTQSNYVKAFPYSISSVGSGADPGVQAVSLQVTVSHPPVGRRPLLSARPAVTSPATEHHRPLAGTKLYCLVTKAHRCKQLAQGWYAALPRVGFEPVTYWSQVQCSTRCTTAPPTAAVQNFLSIDVRPHNIPEVTTRFMESYSILAWVASNKTD